MRVSIALLLLTALAGACCQHPTATQNLDPEQLRWATFTHPTLGYSLAYPEDFQVVTDGGEVAFRYGGVPVRVVWVTAPEAEARGLWAGHPATGETALGGRPGRKYSYEHWDGPFCARTVSHVIEFEGKLLALELRTASDPDLVQQRMLDSFRLPSGG